MNDSQTTLQELKDQIIQFTTERGWDRHDTPKNLAISISLEAAELLEHFQWDEYLKNDKEAIAGELADVLAFAFNFAQTMDIDIATAYRAKLAKAAIKYPVELFNPDTLNQDKFHEIKQSHRQEGSA